MIDSGATGDKFEFIAIAGERCGQHQRGARPRIVLGVTGGIAAYKAAEVVRGLTRAGADIQHIALARRPVRPSDNGDPSRATR